MRPTAALLALAILCTLTPPAQAHRMRPSALTLRTLPAPAGHVEVVWQVALANGRPTPLDLDLPEHCRDTDGPRRTTTDPSAITTRFEIDCGPQGLTRGVLKIEGLSDTGTEVLATIDGATHLLSRDRPHLQLGAPSAARGLGAYVGLGVEHILLGLDHLCFVLGLLLLIRARWRLLLGTITAFTLAHSATLALAVLGVVSPHARAVEAIIALSVLLLAVELAQGQRDSLLWRRPWLFALVCGLLHGLGFAGALAGVGLPPDRIPEALLLFNLGVELGQLALVAAALAIGALASRLALERARALERPLIYGLGGLAAWWVIERTIQIMA